MLVFAFFLDASAQQNALDSMLTLNQSLAGERKINNLINISRQYFILGDTAGIPYALEAIELSRQMNFEKGEGMANLFLALLYDLHDTDKAIEYYYRSSNILEKFDHPWTAFGYDNIANIYRDRGWYPESMEYLLKSLKVHERFADTLQMAKILSGIGFLNTRLGNNTESIEWQRKALALLKHIQDDEIRAVIYGRIGIAYDEMNEYDSAHFYNDKAIEIFTKFNDDFYLSLWLGNKANTYIKQQKYALATDLIKKARKHAKSENDIPNLLINSGRIAIETGRFAEAEKILDSAILLTINYKLRNFQADACYSKYELYKKQGKYSQALDFYIRYSSIMDSLLDEQKTGQIAQMKIRYQTEEKEKALLIEKAENERLAKEKALTEIALYNRNLWIISISGAGLIAILILLFISQRNKQKARAEKDAALILEREKGMKAIFEAQEEERKRIAKDLHDGLGQEISAIKMYFQHLATTLLQINPGIKADVEKIGKMITEAGTDVRNISHQMMPRALTELGLVEALEDMIDKSFSKSHIICKFEHYNIHERLPQHVEIGLYRIAQELLNNIIKHSGAEKVDVQLMNIKNHCVLIIQDDGMGIQEKTKKDGVGMMNITNRLRSLNGEMNIESENGKGTMATIRIALE